MGIGKLKNALNQIFYRWTFEIFWKTIFDLKFLRCPFFLSNFCDDHFFFSSQFFATLILHSKVSKTCTFANLRYALHYISERLSISSSHNLDSSRHVWRISKFFWSLHVLLHWKKKHFFSSNLNLLRAIMFTWPAQKNIQDLFAFDHRRQGRAPQVHVLC